jgi:adenosylmethionine-8-amino-7-oxononanoate aminotransferase
MTQWNTEALIEADKRFVWHPFTNMREWCAPGNEPLVLVEGNGACLRDSRGREYIDGNSSIWTNIHGHNHPHINAAIRRQLDRVAHTSFLGFTNPAAIELARAIVELFPKDSLSRVFFSDDGSTGIEVALRIADQYWRLRHSRKHQFIAFKSSYHGDTAGAASLGATAMFQSGPSHWNFPAMQVPSVQALEQLSPSEAAKIAAVVIEPLIQGAAGMRLWPLGTLRAVRDWCDRTDTLLIADEVMTGFGRTGRMFAIEHEAVLPDMVVLAKGLSGGYLPVALTLVAEKLFSAFDGSVAEGKALAYGHSYTGNALGCAAAKASLEIFETERVLEALQPKIQQLSEALAGLRQLPGVVEVRQCGFIAGIELDEGEPGFAAEVCIEARQHGLLTRPVRNVVVLMPPLCITIDQLRQAVKALRASIIVVWDRTSARDRPLATAEPVQGEGGPGRRRNIAMSMSKKLRLDQLLVSKGLFGSREQAQRAVMAGEIKIGTRTAAKPSQLLEADAAIAVKPTRKYVGRGALKLEGALDHFRIDVHGKMALDIGASTGGFTDCLLQRGAGKVYAVDVGHGQLDWKLRNDPRVVVLEKLNARLLSREHIPELVDVCVIDISFISLTLILPNAFDLITPSGMILALIKPQFELQRADVGRGGVVRDPELQQKAQDKIVAFVTSLGHVVTGIVPSSIKGADGNQEFFACLRKRLG